MQKGESKAEKGLKESIVCIVIGKYIYTPAELENKKDGEE